MLSFHHHRDSKNKRRQSAPPIGQDFDPNATRNQEYIRALETFNEWRSQHQEISNHTSTATNLPLTIPEDFAVEIGVAAPIPSRIYKHNKKRLSLPTGPSSDDVDSPHRSGGSQTKQQNRRERRATAARKANESSIMEEGPSPGSAYKKDDDVRRFEELHCQSVAGTAFDLDADGFANSPPHRFYKKNAKPYHERLFAKTPTNSIAATPPGNSKVDDIEYATPGRASLVPAKPTRRRKSGQSGPVPKIRNSLNCSKSKASTETDSMSEPSHLNGSYKNYDLNSSSIYDEYVISSKAYKGKMNQSAVHTYQQVMNKHGEFVEYALPLVDDPKSPLCQKVVAATSAGVVATEERTSMGKVKNDKSQYGPDLNEQLMDENFKFLAEKCNLNFSDSIGKFIFDEPSLLGNRQVTDLDQSVLEKGKSKYEFEL